MPLETHGDILFCGDPHGDFRPVLAAVRAQRPAAVVLLGDMDLERPLHEEMAEAERLGAEVWWIHGNHDADRDHWYRNLFDSRLADRSLHGRVVEIAGLRVAGLGGVFREKVWQPKLPGGPKFRTREEAMAAMPKQNRWRGGLPMKYRATIFPEDYERLADLGADVLVTHEAPSCHRYGFAELDLLAQSLGARAVVHGHHHEGYADEVEGIRVCGVAKGGVLRSRDVEPVPAAPAPR